MNADHAALLARYDQLRQIVYHFQKVIPKTCSRKDDREAAENLGLVRENMVLFTRKPR